MRHVYDKDSDMLIMITCLCNIQVYLIITLCLGFIDTDHVISETLL